ncbi:DUF4194 domain-containing protein [Aerolutibacter ruishenii]|uniref:Uncharacterized protein DUF4194 n=1 Tax=Aerolutibacter ruishenii TaxID=686800 RepID=A0A562LV91_9GAMM|nr:DUF4194 domain-containing protein [Lysobacter ruishenii]TWI11561.1 uncharacterized protein DUF4194 [Lysobacter ruishenii]
MKRSWAHLSQQSGGTYTPQDFERAAYRLVTEQVLYASDRRSRNAYHLVETWLGDFAAALEPLGIRLERNAHFRYIVALPAHAEGVAVSLNETLLALVLRQRYDQAMRRGEVEEHGEVTVELPDLQEAWLALTSRPMPELGALRDLLRTARRWALCREEESEPGDLQPFRIVVRPAIVEIIGPQWLQRLDQHNLDDDMEDDGGGHEDDVGEDRESNDQSANPVHSDVDGADAVASTPAMTEGGSSHVPA